MSAGAIVYQGNIIAGVEVSSKQAETHQFQSVATEFPLQSGAIVADHVFQRPIELEVTFTAANTVGTAKTPKEIFDAFYAHWQARDLLKVLTEHHTYDNMVIVSFTPEHKAPNKGALSCTLKLQQINFVNLVAVPYVNAKTPSAQSTKKRGQMLGLPLPPPPLN